MAEAAPDEVVRRARALAAAKPGWTLLVDGRSGAGKSTLADRVVAATGAVLVRLDDLYPGWDGLAAGADAARRGVLVPRATGRSGVWRRWEWGSGRPGAAVAMPAAGGLVLEGCGVLTRRSAPLADLTVWVRLEEARRYERAMARDGDAFRPHWRRWAEQEDAVVRAEHPQALADLVVDGARVRPLPSGCSTRAQ